MPERKDGGRRIKRFLEIRPRERNNSKSIRRLLFDVIWHDFQQSTLIASARFRSILKGNKDPRKFRTHGRGLSADSIYKVTRDTQPVTFSQLDAIAQHLGMPLGLVLLFTRIRSEIELAEGHQVKEALNLIASCKAALTELEKTLLTHGSRIDDAYEALSHAQFEALHEAYERAYRDMRTTLL